MKTKILELLKGREGYVSGQELCEQFGVSRTAIWKTVNQLKEEGYEIQSVNRKGYRLISSPDILSESEISAALSLQNTPVLNKIIYLDEVDSTNTYAKKTAGENAPDWTLIAADRQLSGRGRRGKSFESPRGAGIFMTLLLRPGFSPNKASMLTLVSGMAVCQGLKEACGLDTQIKWPNDIVADGKKICGILTEMSAEIESIHYVITGIGINVNNPSFPDEIKETATSVYLETGNTHRRSDIIACVLKHFKRYYDIFLETRDLSILKDEYNSLMINRNKQVLIIHENNEYEAVARCIDSDGELIIERDGRLSKVLSGEVSVRGVYGYV